MLCDVHFRVQRNACKYVCVCVCVYVCVWKLANYNIAYSSQTFYNIFLNSLGPKDVWNLFKMPRDYFEEQKTLQVVNFPHFVRFKNQKICLINQVTK